MASKIYYAYDGTEIINAERTETYALGLSWFTPVYNTYEVADMAGLERTGYISPEEDQAPWFDPDEPGSYTFYGAYPLDVTGIEGSSRGSTPFESVRDGGAPGRIRHAIKTVVFSVMLVAEDERGAEYGMRWLRRALLGGLCSDRLTTTISAGLRLDYLASDPVFDTDDGQEAIGQEVALQRHLHRVTFNVGPTEPTKRRFSCGGEIWMTTFTGTVGNPFETGYERDVFTINTNGTVTYAAGLTGIGSNLFTYFDEPCESSVFDPLYDPLCLPLIEPPAPPNIPLGCFELPSSWQRKQVQIPASLVPDWGQVVPIVRVAGPSADLRGIRIRFYPDADGDGDTADDPCNFTGDMLISWLPANSILTLDGVQEEVLIVHQGRLRRADSLVFGSDSKPFTWPSLSCGHAHLMTVDYAAPGALKPQIDLSLTPRAV